MNAHIQTKSIEALILPIREQVKQLIELQQDINENASKSQKTNKEANTVTSPNNSYPISNINLETVQHFRQAVDQFAATGERVAYENPAIQAELLSACYEVRETMNSFERGFLQPPAQHNGNVVVALMSRNLSALGMHLLSNITRILLLVDSANVRKIQAARDQVLLSLQRLETCEVFPEFMREFGEYGRHLVQLGLLTGERQSDLVNEGDKSEMACTRSILEKTTPMLLTCSKLQLRHPHSLYARRLRANVLQHLRETLHQLDSTLQGCSFFTTFMATKPLLWMLFRQWRTSTSAHAESETMMLQILPLFEEVASTLQLSSHRPIFPIANHSQYRNVTSSNGTTTNHQQNRNNNNNNPVGEVSGMSIQPPNHKSHLSLDNSRSPAIISTATVDAINALMTEIRKTSASDEQNSLKMTERVLFLVDRLQEQVYHPILTACGEQLKEIQLSTQLQNLKMITQSSGNSMCNGQPHVTLERRMEDALKEWEDSVVVPLSRICFQLSHVAESAGVCGTCGILANYVKVLFSLLSLCGRSCVILSSTPSTAVQQQLHHFTTSSPLPPLMSHSGHSPLHQLNNSLPAAGFHHLLSHSSHPTAASLNPSTSSSTSSLYPVSPLLRNNPKHAHAAFDVLVDAWHFLVLSVGQARQQILHSMHHTHHTHTTNGPLLTTLNNTGQSHLWIPSSSSSSSSSAAGGSSTLPQPVASLDGRLAAMTEHVIENGNASASVASLNTSLPAPVVYEKVLAKRLELTTIAQDILGFSQGKGPLQTTSHFFQACRAFLVEATSFDKILVAFRETVSQPQILPELTRVMQSYTEALIAFHHVLNSPAQGQEAHFRKVDSLVVGVSTCSDWLSRLDLLLARTNAIMTSHRTADHNHLIANRSYKQL